MSEDLESLRRDAARWRYVKEMCYSTEMNERDYVGFMLPEYACFAPSTSEMFEKAVDAAMAATSPPPQEPVDA